MTDKPTTMETLLGGGELQLLKNDGNYETVRVLQLPVRSYPALQAAIQNEPRTVELYCGKPSGWSDTLTIAAFESVIAEGERINGDFFLRWLERQKKRADLAPKADPDQVERMLSVLQKSNPGLLNALLEGAGLSLPTTSPNSPSKPA